MTRHGLRRLNDYHPKPGDVPSRLLNLTPELRVMIYEFAITEDQPIVVPATRELGAPPLHCVNQQIRDECLQRGMYWRNNSFHVLAEDGCVRGPASFCEDASEHFAHIRSIIFEPRFSEPFMHDMRMASNQKLPRIALPKRTPKPRIMRLKLARDSWIAILNLFLQSGLSLSKISLTGPYMRGEVNNSDEYIAWVALREFHAEWDQTMAKIRAAAVAKAKAAREAGTESSAARDRKT